MLFWGNFELFWVMSGWFGVYVRPEICFDVYSYRLITFIFQDFLFSGSLIFLPFWGHFERFWVLSGYVWVVGRPENFFGLYLYILITFVF